MLQKIFFEDRMKLALLSMGLLLAISCSGQGPQEEAEEDEQEEAQEASEVALQLEQLPVAVQQAAKNESEGATVLGYSEEEEDGETMYEMETTMDGRTRDVIFDADGNVASVETETAMEDVPDAARSALQAAIGDGSLDSVETVTEHGMVSYEATYTEGGKEMEVTVDADGKRVE